MFIIISDTKVPKMYRRIVTVSGRKLSDISFYNKSFQLFLSELKKENPDIFRFFFDITHPVILTKFASNQKINKNGLERNLFTFQPDITHPPYNNRFFYQR